MNRAETFTETLADGAAREREHEISTSIHLTMDTLLDMRTIEGNIRKHFLLIKEPVYESVILYSEGYRLVSVSKTPFINMYGRVHQDVMLGVPETNHGNDVPVQIKPSVQKKNVSIKRPFVSFVSFPESGTVAFLKMSYTSAIEISFDGTAALSRVRDMPCHRIKDRVSFYIDSKSFDAIKFKNVEIKHARFSVTTTSSLKGSEHAIVPTYTFQSIDLELEFKNEIRDEYIYEVVAKQISLPILVKTLGESFLERIFSNQSNVLLSNREIVTPAFVYCFPPQNNNFTSKISDIVNLHDGKRKPERMFIMRKMDGEWGHAIIRDRHVYIQSRNGVRHCEFSIEKRLCAQPLVCQVELYPGGSEFVIVSIIAAMVYDVDYNSATNLLHNHFDRKTGSFMYGQGMYNQLLALEYSGCMTSSQYNNNTPMESFAAVKTAGVIFSRVPVSISLVVQKELYNINHVARRHVSTPLYEGFYDTVKLDTLIRFKTLFIDMASKHNLFKTDGLILGVVANDRVLHYKIKNNHTIELIVVLTRRSAQEQFTLTRIITECGVDVKRYVFVHSKTVGYNGPEHYECVANIPISDTVFFHRIYFSDEDAFSKFTNLENVTGVSFVIECDLKYDPRGIDNYIFVFNSKIRHDKNRADKMKKIKDLINDQIFTTRIEENCMYTCTDEILNTLKNVTVEMISADGEIVYNLVGELATVLKTNKQCCVFYHDVKDRPNDYFYSLFEHFQYKPHPHIETSLTLHFKSLIVGDPSGNVVASVRVSETPFCRVVDILFVLLKLSLMIKHGIEYR